MPWTPISCWEMYYIRFWPPILELLSKGNFWVLPALPYYRQGKTKNVFKWICINLRIVRISTKKKMVSLELPLGVSHWPPIAGGTTNFSYIIILVPTTFLLPRVAEFGRPAHTPISKTIVLWNREMFAMGSKYCSWVFLVVVFPVVLWCTHMVCVNRE